MIPRHAPVKRHYDASRRQVDATVRRLRVLEAARELFAERGYAATTMSAVAERAEVALDTVYASVGPKPEVLTTLVELAISGGDEPVDAEERDYVRAIQAEPGARRKLEIYAQAIRAIHERLAPVFLALRTAAPTHPDVAAMWETIAQRRADNMRLFATNLAATGELRPELSIDEVADIIWATNAAEFYDLLVQERGWSADRFEEWLADAWQRLLLATINRR